MSDTVKRRKGEIRMATQLAETPTLYGEDAEAVLKQVRQAPDKKKIEELKRQLAETLKDVHLGRPE